MTEDEKRILQEEFTKAGSVPALLEAMARAETKEFQDLKDQVEHGPHHPTGDELYKYVLGWLDRKESLLIMDHLVLCGRCLREVVKIRRLEEELTEDALARADAVPWYERVKSFISKLSFPVSLHARALEALRSGETETRKRHYTPDTKLIISAEAPADGYVTVFHGREDTGKVELVFPREADDDPRVSEHRQMPFISGTVQGPPGKNWFKAFWTRQLLIDPEKYDLANECDRGLAVQEFCDRLDELRDEDFRITVVDYEVVNE